MTWNRRFGHVDHIDRFWPITDGGRGLARDTRVRWAPEEVGQGYDVRYLAFAALKKPAHLALHPFGQIPTYEQGDLALFETGAIMFHIAERYPGLLPVDANARAVTWMFAALNTVEPPVIEDGVARMFERDTPWHAQRLPLVGERALIRLGQLSHFLGDAEWLDGTFSAGDLLIVSVLLRARAGGCRVRIPISGLSGVGRSATCLSAGLCRATCGQYPAHRARITGASTPCRRW